MIDTGGRDRALQEVDLPFLPYSGAQDPSTPIHAPRHKGFLAAGACKGPPSKSDPWPLAGLGPTSIKNWGAVGTGRDRGEGI